MAGLITADLSGIPSECGSFGYASSDIDPKTGVGRTRLYKKSECDAMEGDWYPSGECFVGGGGNWSLICKANNKLDAINAAKIAKYTTYATVIGAGVAAAVGAFWLYKKLMR